MLIIEFIAILSCTLFAGSTTYVSVVEHPARLECGTELATTVFKPSYRRAFVMQTSLALLAAITGVFLGLNDGNELWFLGSFILFSIIPFTFIAVIPITRQLLAPNGKCSSDKTFLLLKKWGYLHAVRSLAGIIAAIIYVFLGITT